MRDKRVLVILAVALTIAAISAGFSIGLVFASRTIVSQVEAAVLPGGTAGLTVGLLSREVLGSVLRNGVVPLAGRIVSRPADPFGQAEVEITEVYTMSRQVSVGGQTLKPGSRTRVFIPDPDQKGFNAGNQVFVLAFLHPNGEATAVGAQAKMLARLMSLRFP